MKQEAVKPIRRVRLGEHVARPWAGLILLVLYAALCYALNSTGNRVAWNSDVHILPIALIGMYIAPVRYLGRYLLLLGLALAAFGVFMLTARVWGMKSDVPAVGFIAAGCIFWIAAVAAKKGWSNDQ